MNNVALWISVGVHDWTAEIVIIVGNVLEKNQIRPIYRRSQEITLGVQAAVQGMTLSFHGNPLPLFEPNLCFGSKFNAEIGRPLLIYNKTS